MASVGDQLYLGHCSLPSFVKRSIKFIATLCKLCENREVSTLPNFTNKLFIIVLGLLLIIFSIFVFTSTQKKSYEPVATEKFLTLEINGTKITPEIAKTPA